MRLRPKAAATRELKAALLTGVLLRGLRDALRGAPMKASARKRLSAMGLIAKSPSGFSRLTPLGLRRLQAAQGTEAGTAETGTGSVHDGPVGSADAPEPSSHNITDARAGDG